jgi:carboxyl-terminal processing protease
MKIFCITLIVPLMCCVTICDGQVKDFRQQALLLKKALQQNHVSPRNIDDQFSEWLYESFLEELDPELLYFSEEDLKTISSYATKLDDELTGNTSNWKFLSVITELYKKSLQRAETTANQLLQAPMSFEAKEVYQEDTVWAKNQTELTNRWKSTLKHRVLSRVYEMQRSSAQSDIMKLEPEARQRAKAFVSRSVKRILNHAGGYENHVASLYLQNIALAFDPHSAYLASDAVENFLASVSSQGYYFGVNLNENEQGDIIIEHLTPGGPAWKSGLLNTGDIIKKIKWDGKEEVDLSGVGLDEINDMLVESNHLSLQVTVSKPGGITETVTLKKDKMESEENIVKSFMLEGKRKVGYISLPGFYSNWGASEGAQCANDVAREIIKLKKEGIEALILDIRFNGGGSLEEAVAMTGIFIDAGPAGIVTNKAGEATTLKDGNRGTVYDGPLVLMINGMSASASEFLAASLQDYQRAVVVGSKSFGKATAQTLFSLDPKDQQLAPSENIKPGTSYANVTIEKIYRITGKTVQTKGVIPHITLPDVYDSIDFREHTMPMALVNDSIFKKTYYQPLLLLPVRELKHKSELRLATHKGFKDIVSASAILGSVNNNTDPLPLNWVDYKRKADDISSSIARVTTNKSKSTAFKVGYHQFESQRMQIDEFVKDFNEAWTKKLETDISLEEAFHITCDYIDITLRNKK